MSELVEQVDYEEAIRALRSWLGCKVEALVGPPDGSGLGGIVWGKLSGTLSESDAHWTPSEPRAEPGVAFQVGSSSECYFVLYPGLYQSGYWVMRDRFFVARMSHVEVGVGLASRP